MTDNSKIEWTEDTASPWYGCTKIAAGCANCYAADLSRRNPKTLGVWGDDGVRIKSKSFCDDLRRWNRRGEREQRQIKVFPSMCDPFEDRPELAPWRQEMFAVIDQCPWVIVQMLTKRPENIPAMIPPYSFHACETGDCPHNLASECNTLAERQYRDNVWLGTSIACRADLGNIAELRKCRDLSPVLFLSAEPLIEDLGEIDLTGIDWVIVGGESGPNARWCDVDSVRSLVSQCKSAGVACFAKQLGAKPVFWNYDDSLQWPEGVYFDSPEDNEPDGPSVALLEDRKGGDWNEWPADLRVREFPKVEADT